jgi:tRNA uracil 4-sulfurtransferase
MNDIILVRVGEIFLKGKNRSSFFRQLVRNARGLVSDLEGVRVEPTYMRLVVRHPPEQRRACIERLQRLFGCSSLSPAKHVERSMEAFVEEAVAQANALPPNATFKIETNRRDKRFPMASTDVSREVGGQVVVRTGRKVNVRQPDRVIEIEIDESGCYVFGEVVPGPGGLPVGTTGQVLTLLSGGIDSPLAAWYAMRRGCNTQAVYFHSFPFTGDKTKEKVLDLARLLARYQGKLAVHVVHFTEVQKQLREASADFAVVLYRRMMMRAACRIALRHNAQALVTGENLGQVASQTLENLAAIEAASTLPVLRPLLGFDKQEIMAEARAIGTYATSILPYDDGCALFMPAHPVTRARIADVEAAEAGLELEAMADSLAAGAERIVVTG